MSYAHYAQHAREHLPSWGELQVRPFSRPEYEFMVEHGFFDDERIELLDGMLVAMSPQSVNHAHVLTRLNKLLVKALGERADVRPQCPLAASDHSMPEPDLAVVALAGQPHGHPRTAHLVVEIADSSLAKDRGLKAQLYAAADITEYWVVNLIESVVEVHTGAERAAYRTVTSKVRGEDIALVAFPDVVIAVDDILP